MELKVGFNVLFENNNNKSKEDFIALFDSFVTELRHKEYFIPVSCINEVKSDRGN